MKIRHPRARDGDGPGVAIDVNGKTVTPDDNGHYDIGDSRGWLDGYAAANGCDPDELLVTDSTCPYCDDYEGDNVGIHAAQAHPDEWQADDGDN